jgi:hypothetical protein
VSNCDHGAGTGLKQSIPITVQSSAVCGDGEFGSAPAEYGGSIVPFTNRKHAFERLYTVAELVELRRQVLRFSRSVPPGAERNQHRQIATSLRWLFKNKAWLDAHTVEGSKSGMDQLTVSKDPLKSKDPPKSNTWRGWIAPWSGTETPSQHVGRLRWRSSLIGKLRRSS